MATLTETKHDGEFIGELAMGIGYHLDVVTLTSGQNLKVGDVVAKVTGTGKYVIYDNASGTAGVAAAAGILFADCNASAADAPARVLVRGPAIVNKNDLGWGTNNAGGITDGIADLLALGIKAV